MSFHKCPIWRLHCGARSLVDHGQEGPDGEIPDPDAGKGGPKIPVVARKGARQNERTATEMAEEVVERMGVPRIALAPAVAALDRIAGEGWMRGLAPVAAALLVGAASFLIFRNIPVTVRAMVAVDASVALMVREGLPSGGEIKRRVIGVAVDELERRGAKALQGLPSGSDRGFG